MSHNYSYWNKTRNYGLSDDVSRRWYETLPSTQPFTEQRQDFVQNGTKEQKKKKTKCRGNRKEQHKRRRVRRQQQKLSTSGENHMNGNVSMTIDGSNNVHSNEEEMDESNFIMNSQGILKGENKRKRQEMNMSEIQVNRSFSQLSISQGNIKKTKATTLSNGSHSQKETNRSPEAQQLTTNNTVQRFKPQYLRVSDKILKQMLSNVIKNGDQIIQALNTNEKVQLIRQMTEATNNLYYLDLQRHLWQDYYNIDMKEGSGEGSRLSKSFAKQHRTCRSYGFPKHIIEERQKTIERQVQQTIIELQGYMLKLEQNVRYWQPSIDSTILSDAINECVKKNQRRLREEFDYKKKMLAFDSNDHHLIYEFYSLRPNQEQIQIAKKIWQTTADVLKTKELEELLRKRIYLQRLPSGIDKIINRSIAAIQLLLSNPVIHKDRRASLISSCSKTITQYKFDLMSINLETIENIKRGHQHILDDLQDKLLRSNCSFLVKQAIENRQQAMRQRHEVYLKHLLQTFFDEAPAAVINE